MAAREGMIPYSGSTLIALAPEHFAAIQRTVGLLFQLARAPAYQALLDAEAEPVLRHAPGNFGVFMGYDFHLTPQGPRLIEVNTNAGGALLNGLHTAALCDPEQPGVPVLGSVAGRDARAQDRRDLRGGACRRARAGGAARSRRDRRRAARASSFSTPSSSCSGACSRAPGSRRASRRPAALAPATGARRRARRLAR